MIVTVGGSGVGEHLLRRVIAAYPAAKQRVPRMDFESATPDDIAAAIADEVGREVAYVPVEIDGARRAAERIAEML